MDADLSHDPKEISKFIELLNQYEFVIVLDTQKEEGVRCL